MSLAGYELVCGCELLYNKETITKGFRTFENGELRRILGIKLQDQMKNERKREQTNVPYKTNGY